MKVPVHGLCVIDDRYFLDYPSVRHMSNKHESRPYYLAVYAKDGIIWAVPLSSHVDKYGAKIKADERRYGECLFYTIAKVKGRESAFLIGNAIPVTEEYIKKPFTVAEVPYVVKNKQLVKELKGKLSRYLALVRQGKMKPAVDILAIEKKLLWK